jgi:hypothetical protein
MVVCGDRLLSGVAFGIDGSAVLTVTVSRVLHMCLRLADVNVQHTGFA